MKKFFLVFLIVIPLFGKIAKSSSIVNSPVGSWINNSLVNYFNNVRSHNESSLQSFTPLYISFINKNRIEITFKFEQPPAVLEINPVGSNNYIAFNKQIKVKFIINNSIIKMQYDNKEFYFKKVANVKSNHVFSEFIKNLIFEKHHRYLVHYFSDGNFLKNKLINRTNLLKVLKNLFQCQDVIIEELGSIKINDAYLPKIIIYYSDKNRTDHPVELAIDIEPNDIKFLNKQGQPIIQLKPFSRIR